MIHYVLFFFFFSSRRRHTRFDCEVQTCALPIGREVVVQADHQLGHGCRHGGGNRRGGGGCGLVLAAGCQQCRSEEHTSELQSLAYLVCRLLLEKKKKKEDYNNLTIMRKTLVCMSRTLYPRA